MKKPILTLIGFALLYSAGAQDIKPTATVEYVSEELSGIIKKDAKVEVIAEGFQFTEGPIWVAKEKMLLLSDVPANTIYKWTEAEGKEVFLKPGGYTGTTERGGFMGSNGLLLTPDGKLWICQHGDRRIAELNTSLSDPKPEYSTVAGEYDGKKLNSPNDLTLSKTGNLYFTDPSYGLASDSKKEIDYQGVYKMDPTGKVTMLLDSIDQPNGIAIFPDQKTLLVSNSDPEKKRWYAYDLAKDGSITSGRIFYDASNSSEPGLCDGFKIDKKGNVFASGPGGIWIFNKSGEILGKIKLEGATAANCALTPDGKTLFITAEKHLLRMKMR
ncbi:SMP-30/gluconolactonase/LRE family protein [Algoriphagus halophytocola]|uniref:SMP-30/gluconolactonase/LRE family protein n=1 Tax=Algoriphagus halophytocola TaxID=2991499 RepID=A0ABY6MPD5_9BACT|nr:SMP-30/gluconolactonase/LRE family protein [Algoriphagus sp. TR-M5]UZD24084.1 SMP-30/gluconolactonase/LRE family protein [Algoriphagus sp. TR-M5]